MRFIATVTLGQTITSLTDETPCTVSADSLVVTEDGQAQTRTVVAFGKTCLGLAAQLRGGATLRLLVRDDARSLVIEDLAPAIPLAA